MIVKNIYCVALFFCFSFCVSAPTVMDQRASSKESDTREITQPADSRVVNFDDSVTLIRAYIQENVLEKLFADHVWQEELDLLLKNYSPAALAFEAEVLQVEQPVLVVFLDSQMDQQSSIQDMLNEKAVEYASKLKIVIVQACKYPSLTKQALIDELPAALIIKDRAEVNRLEGGNLATLKLFIETHSKCIQNSGWELKKQSSASNS